MVAAKKYARVRNLSDALYGEIFEARCNTDNSSVAIKKLLVTPNESPYGILITEEYYFENTPNTYHIISRDNIIRIDYEEERADDEIYLEVVLDIGKRLEVRGLSYKKEEFDL